MYGGKRPGRGLTAGQAAPSPQQTTVCKYIVTIHASTDPAAA